MGLLDIYNKGGSSFTKAVGVSPIIQASGSSSKASPLQSNPIPNTGSQPGGSLNPANWQGGWSAPATNGLQNVPGSVDSIKSGADAYNNQYAASEAQKTSIMKRFLKELQESGGNKYTWDDARALGLSAEQIQSYVQQARNGQIGAQDLTADDVKILTEWSKDRNKAVYGMSGSGGTNIPGDNKTYGPGSSIFGIDQKTYDQHPMTGFFSGEGTGLTANSQPGNDVGEPNPLLGSGMPTNTPGGGFPGSPLNPVGGQGTTPLTSNSPSITGTNPLTQAGSSAANPTGGPLQGGSPLSAYKTAGDTPPGTNNLGQPTVPSGNGNVPPPQWFGKPSNDYSSFTNVLENSGFTDTSSPLVQQFIQRYGQYGQYDPNTHRESAPGAYVVGRGRPSFSGNGADEWAHKPDRVMYFDSQGRPVSSAREDGFFVLEGDNVNGDKIKDMQNVDSNERQRNTRQRATTILAAIVGGVFFGPAILGGLQSLGSAAMEALSTGIAGLPEWATAVFKGAKTLSQVLGLARFFGINVPGVGGSGSQGRGGNMTLADLLGGAGSAIADNRNINDYQDRANTIRDRQYGLNPARDDAMQGLRDLNSIAGRQRFLGEFEEENKIDAMNSARKANASGDWFSGAAVSDIANNLNSKNASRLREKESSLRATAGLFDPSALNRQEMEGLPFMFNARAQRNNSVADFLRSNPNMIEQILSMGGQAAEWLRNAMSSGDFSDPPENLQEILNYGGFNPLGDDPPIDFNWPDTDAFAGP